MKGYDVQSIGLCRLTNVFYPSPAEIRPFFSSVMSTRFKRSLSVFPTTSYLLHSLPSFDSFYFLHSVDLLIKLFSPSASKEDGFRFLHC